MPLLFLLLGAVFPDQTQPQVRERLKCHVLARGVDFFYGLNIYPSEKNKLLFHWEVVIKHIHSGKILTVLRASSMRGQENIFERAYRPDGSKITIKAVIEIKKPVISYQIRRSRGETVLYSYQGKKKIHL